MWRFRNRGFVRYIGVSMAGTLLSVLAGWMLSGRNAAAAAFFCSLFWCTLHLSKESRRYQGMRLLAGQIDEILHGNDRPEFQHFQEGDLEILRDEIYKMTIRLRTGGASSKGEDFPCGCPCRYLPPDTDAAHCAPHPSGTAAKPGT